MAQLQTSNFIFRGEEIDYDIPKESMGKYILEILKLQDSDENIIIDETKTLLTNEEVIKNSVKFSTFLKTLGVESNDVVSCICENNVNFCYLLLGTLLNGSIFNPLNPSYYPAEIEHALSLSKPKIIISSSSCLNNLSKVLPKVDFVQHVYTIGEIFEPWQYQLDQLENILESTKANVDTFCPENNFDPTEQGAVILSSSGTTGLPKGVLLTHANLRQIIGYAGHKDYFNTKLATTLQVVPNFHVMGLSLQLSAMANQFKIILMKKFTPDLFLKLIETYQVSLLLVVPSLLLFLAKSPAVAKYNLSCLKDIIAGAAPVSEELKKEIQDKFPNCRVREMYGATELSGAISIQTKSNSQAESSGILMPGALAKVVDVENNKNVGPMKLGELCFKGSQVMKKYVNNEDSTRQCIDEDGFFHTGDMGYYDETGCIFVVDRIKELIKYKGFQVAPAELEALIISHPGVRDCGVIGIPDERAGELPLAFVVAQPGENISEKDVITFVEERISVQKRLYGGVKFVEEIPKNSSGKILRKKLKELIRKDAVQVQ